MFKNLFLLSCVVFKINCCFTKTVLKNNSLKGLCGYEIIKKDTCKIKFITDSIFIRTGSMYIQTSGTYMVKNDTLKVNYYCENCFDITSICCGIQTFSKTKNGKLKLVSWITHNGKLVKIPKHYQDIKLFKCSNQ